MRPYALVSESHPAFADFMADMSCALMPLHEEDFQKLVSVLMLTHTLSRREVGRCRLTVSKPELKARLVSILLSVFSA
jgi:hypothetical protein